MTSMKNTLAALAVAGALTAAATGLSAGLATAEPGPPPPSPTQGEVPPDWAPKKPTELYLGQPVVWTSNWNGRWGVWINGQFLTLT